VRRRTDTRMIANLQPCTGTALGSRLHKVCRLVDAWCPAVRNGESDRSQYVILTLSSPGFRHSTTKTPTRCTARSFQIPSDSPTSAERKQDRCSPLCSTETPLDDSVLTARRRSRTTRSSQNTSISRSSGKRRSSHPSSLPW